MCLRDPIRRKAQAPRKSLLPKRDKSTYPAPGKTSKSLPHKHDNDGAAALLKDLLCAEVLSPYKILGRSLPHKKLLHGLTGTDHNQTQRARELHIHWSVKNGSNMYPSNFSGNSFQSKVRELSPSLLYPNIPTGNSSTKSLGSRRHVQSSKPQTVLKESAVYSVEDSMNADVEFGEAMGVLLERQRKVYHKLSNVYVQCLMGFTTTLSAARTVSLSCGRRSCVHLISKLVGLLRLSTMTAAHAVAYLDRFLCQRTITMVEEESEGQLQLAATACMWIAAKMDNTATPTMSSLRGQPGLGFFNEESLGKMEAVVLQVLEWRMLIVTASDFVANMLAHLPRCGVPLHLLQNAEQRADELIQGILAEVEFLDYEPSVVGICVMQCLLDETLPLQAASHMAFMRASLAVDTLTAQQCYKTLVDMVVDPLSICCAPSPNRILDV